MNRLPKKSPISPGRGFPWLPVILLLVLFGHGRAFGQLSLPDVVCVGSSKRYWVDSTQGSTYEWKINGVVQPATTHEIFITWQGTLGVTGSPHTLSVRETSFYGCEGLEISGLVYVNPPLPVSISILASQNPACSGTPITFTASAVNGGTAPSYTWRVNGVITGADAPVFTYVPASGDMVTCEVTSNAVCASNTTAVSSPLVMQIAPAPAVTFAPCFDVITTADARPFKLRGGLPLGGHYAGIGVNSATGIFSPAVAGAGTFPLTYTYTNAYDCIDSAIYQLTVLQVVPFACGQPVSDVRDNKEYPTVQIGTQCWMAVNLDYGERRSSLSPMTDNCVSEKYCYNNDVTNCGTFGGLYQWDELMKYGDTPGDQGMCPPGWHVPEESEWNTLMNFYSGPGRAGIFLRNDSDTGFRALPGGVLYQNNRFSHLNLAALFWTSTPSSPLKVFTHGINNVDYSVSLYESLKGNAFPVRCLKDN